MNQLDVYYRRPRQWESFLKLCKKELKRLSSNVKCAMFDMMSQSVVSATSDVASELSTDEQVVCQDLTGELSNSLSEIRKETRSWKTKWRHVFVNHKPQSSTVVCCHERELCGFVHGDDFINTGDSVQWMWIESRIKEGLNFERCAHLGVDGADETVTILNRLVTWVCLSGSRNQAAVQPRGRVGQLIVLCYGCETNQPFDCANQLGVREICERRDPGAHLRLYRDLPDRRVSDENHDCAQVDDFPGRQD